ncbi:AMP-binding protein [Zavarzinella formosa]|uniref:AMP-binding protein n=1 Tax=Zavarzinella formosa TaxID=360055 RepID=UPI0012FC10EA|nr:AMP-binding protein [Zavarzinella formosa]
MVSPFPFFKGFRYNTGTLQAGDSPVCWAFISNLQSPEWIDLTVPAGLFVAWLLAVILIPHYAVKPVFWIITRTLYRLHPIGRENIPRTGPVLLLSNHVTYVDWLLLWAASPRHVRFVAYKGFTKNPLFKWFLRVTDSILIDGEGGPRQIVQSLKQIAEALDRGEAICLFPEGALSRGSGVMLPFRRGFERVLKQTKNPVTVVPVCLYQLWGSLFSYSGNKVFWKWPQHLPYHVTIVFGKPMPQTVTAMEVRLAIQQLTAETSIIASKHLRPVHRQFVRLASRFRYFRKLCFVDASTPTAREINYLKSLVGCICMARWLKPQIGTEKNVGIWLPTSVGSALANIALAFHHRVSVNLNYTMGMDAIRSAVRQTGMKTIITSKKFLTRAPLEIEGVNLVYLEDALRGITKWQRIRSLLMVVLLPGWVIERLVLRLGGHKIDDLVTIIFSSGSTGEPKGVMLSHRNISSNAVASVSHLGIVPGDSLMGVLPFFHSFGYTVLLWLPLQIGAGVVYYPDPRQAKEIGELCKKFKCMGLISTATFLRFYLRRCDPEDFKALRILVCGAEKLPPALAHEFEAKFGILPMEGYGCTELSPVVSANVPDVELNGTRQIRNKVGTIGHPIPGVAARTVDPDTLNPLAGGVEGMLQIKGPNVMVGYLDRPDLTAKAITDGWYTTGDMAKIDEDGFLTITGRLSRFAKIGGEMVPLEKVEEDLHAVLGTNDRVLAVTAVPDERKGERLIVLHTPAMTMPVKELTDQLGKRGIPNLWIPGDREFYPVPDLPLLGSGKLDLKRVREMALEIVK